MNALRTLLRPVAVVATGAVVTTTVAVAAPAAAAPAPDDRAASWLTTQLKDGLVHNNEFDFDDYGLSADVAIGLASIGGHGKTVRRIARAVARNVDAYTAPADGEVYAGSTAKAATLALVAGRDPRAFGGVDLVDRLESRTAEAPPLTGRIEDQSQYGDFANTIGQGYAAFVLSEAGSAEAAAARSFLLAQQCEEGYFRLDFSAKDAVDQSCDGASAEQSAPDTDATALTVLALLALPREVQDQQVRAAVRDAARWLKSVQKDNGSFGGGPTTKRSNANSTGLAAWALGEQGSCKAAKQAATWVKPLQVSGKVTGTPFAGDRGAIAYDRKAFRAGRTDGITRATRDEWRRTTAQAARGLSFLRGC